MGLVLKLRIGVMMLDEGGTRLEWGLKSPSHVGLEHGTRGMVLRSVNHVREGLDHYKIRKIHLKITREVNL